VLAFTTTENNFVHYKALKLFKMARISQNSPPHYEAVGLYNFGAKILVKENE
jgi:hypothetical protein